MSGTVQSITETALTGQPKARRGRHADPVTVTLDEETRYGAVAGQRRCIR